jgi:hypothetical protein
MNKSFSYFTPVVRQKTLSAKPERWAKTQEYWEKKAYRKCVLHILEYLGVETSDDKNVYELHHGSITIYLTIKDEHVYIEAPFLDISKGQQLPLLRQAAQINFEPLTLTNILLKDEQLKFFFETPLKMSEPFKIFDVLKEICIHADNYDDAFIKRFKALRIIEPNIKPYSAEEKDLALKYFKTILSETKEAIGYMEEKRLHSYIWDVLILMLLRIDDCISPQGHLRGRIEKYMSDMVGTFDLSEKIVIGKAALKEISAISDTDFLEDLYLIETLVPFKTLSTADTLKSRLSRALSQVEKEYQDGDYLACTLTAPYHLLYLLYEYSLTPDHYALVKDFLPSGSGLPFKESADIYLSKLREITSNIRQSDISLPETVSLHHYPPITSP